MIPMSVALSCWQIANGACKTAGLALFNFSNEPNETYIGLSLSTSYLGSLIRAHLKL